MTKIITLFFSHLKTLSLIFFLVLEELYPKEVKEEWQNTAHIFQ